MLLNYHLEILATTQHRVEICLCLLKSVGVSTLNSILDYEFFFIKDPTQFYSPDAWRYVQNRQ